MNEMLFMRQMLGGADYLSMAMLVGLFLIVIMRREMIALPALFRLGVLFFAASIALPPLMLPLAQYISGNSFVRGNMGVDGSVVFMLLMNGLGPALQALTVLCLFNAVMPRVFKRADPPSPQKHPLDD